MAGSDATVQNDPVVNWVRDSDLHRDGQVLRQSRLSELDSDALLNVRVDFFNGGRLGPADVYHRIRAGYLREEIIRDLSGKEFKIYAQPAPLFGDGRADEKVALGARY